uniref:Uncharacterized protein n=1 Tax=Amphimedon queenslandica TaxID=400682 RepID=A0A1X7SK33_AMPQE
MLYHSISPSSQRYDREIHRQLKAALIAEPHPELRTESLPLVLLGIRTAVKEDLHDSTAELLYGTTICLPGEFFSLNHSHSLSESSDYVARLKYYIHSLSLTPRPLQHPYDGPYKVLENTEQYDVININGNLDTISIDPLKLAYIDKTSTLLPNHKSLITSTHHSTSSSTP